MSKYEIHEIAGGRFGVYEVTEVSYTLIKSFKTRKGAESWVARKG